jgi:hypothetical protein
MFNDLNVYQPVPSARARFSETGMPGFDFFCVPRHPPKRCRARSAGCHLQNQKAADHPGKHRIWKCLLKSAWHWRVVLLNWPG